MRVSLSSIAAMSKACLWMTVNGHAADAHANFGSSKRLSYNHSFVLHF